MLAFPGLTKDYHQEVNQQQRGASSLNWEGYSDIFSKEMQRQEAELVEGSVGPSLSPAMQI